jgi:nuclear pore complex protein Nup54
MPTFGTNTNTQPAPSPFGGPASTLTPVKPAGTATQPGGFSFGAGTAGTGTFGAPASTPAFGTGATSAPAFGSGFSSGFGAGAGTTSNALVPAQQQPNNFAFGSQQQQQLQNTSFQGMNSAQNAQLPDDSAIRELQSIKESYVAGPNNSRFKFQHLFLNVVKDPARRVKPNDIDELQWREAMRRAGGSDNAQNLWPVPYNGFNGLLERKSAQNDAVKEHKDRLEVLQKSVAALANRHETIVRVQMDAIKARHQELSRNLLKTLRYIDALEARFSRAVGYDKSTPKIVLQKLSEELRQMESLIAANSAQGLLGRVDSVASAARVQVGSARSGGQANGRADIDAESLDQAFNIMKDYADAIAKMDGAIHRNARDIQVIRSEI